jgi:uncharacterized protein
VRRTICWRQLWNEQRKGVGVEHLLLSERRADSMLIAFDEERGPFRLTYQLMWDHAWSVREARLCVATERDTRSLNLLTDANGQWHKAGGEPVSELEGCTDVDIWPTPFTNSFPMLRTPMAVGERKEFCVAWISAPELTVKPQRQAYTRMAEQLYLFESLDGSGFTAELPVDGESIVKDYPGLFQRVSK